MNSVIKYIATLGFIGYLPVAPGSFATLFACALYIIIRPSLIIQCIFLIFMIPIGVICAHRTERLMNEKDSSHIVIDEFCGYLLSVLFLTFNIPTALLAFFLFRIFDILKPFPIKALESALSGGTGIMVDDMVAALYTNIIMQVTNFYFFQ
jgi:phosphatidylglycerophosphatase A